MQRKRIIILTAAVLAVAALSTGLWLYMKREEAPVSVTQTGELEQLDTEDTALTELAIIDDNESYSEEQEQDYEERVRSFCDEFFSLLTNIKSDTPDYTETVQAYFGTDEELFRKGNRSIVPNFYKEFRYKNLSSAFLDFKLDHMRLWDTPVPEISVIGAIQIQGSMDGLGEGAYSFPVNIVLVDNAGELQVHTLSMRHMYLTDGLTAEYVPDSGEMSIVYSGTKVFDWYFNDYDVFVNKGVSDRSTDPEDYDIVQ